MMLLYTTEAEDKGSVLAVGNHLVGDLGKEVGHAFLGAEPMTL